MSFFQYPVLTPTRRRQNPLEKASKIAKMRHVLFTIQLKSVANSS